MSYGRANGANGYGNGYRSQPNRYDDDYREPTPPSSQRSRRTGRTGGYGGFDEEEPDRSAGSSRERSNGRSGAGYASSTNSTNPYANARADPYTDPYSSTPPPPEPGSRRTREPREQREPREHREPREQREQRERDTPPISYSSSRDRLRPPPRGGTGESRSYGTGPATQRIEGVLNHINEKWPVLTTDDCVPAQLAMQLMDTSSLGRGTEYDDFRYTGKDLQTSLRAVVNEHHQGFNSSIGAFHKIQTSIQSSQDNMRNLQGSLGEGKTNLTGAKTELGDLTTASKKYDEMLQIIDRIEKIQTMPEQLDARISEKRFITAVDVLQDGLRLVRHSSLDSINALSDLKVYFSNQETSITDILLEELHDHLYLKSPYTNSRWRAYNPSSVDTSDSVQGVSNMDVGIRPFYRFMTNLDSSTPMMDDANRNTEEDSFEYIHMIIEALNKIGALELAVDKIEHRLPLELFAVVEKTNQEVDSRHPAHLRSTQTRDWGRLNKKPAKSDNNDAVLTDLLHTLYSKFEAIAEGHRAVHEVIKGIVKREGIKKTDNLLKGFKELWKLYKSEMRSLLHDYLATDGDASYDSRNNGVGKNIFRRNQRDKTKKVFKLGDLDRKSVQFATEQDELDKILQASVPGLVSKSGRRSAVPDKDKSTVSYDSTAAGHKLLIEPSVFNISVLLPPSLVFLQRLKDAVPPDSDIAISTLTSFLDDFLINVFNPQMEETLAELSSQSFMHIEAFQQDPNWTEHSSMPVFKGTLMFYALVKEFCKMLDNIPQDQLFTDMILGQLKTYYDRCTTWSETIVSRAKEEGKSELKPSAAILKEGGDYLSTIKDIWAAEGDAKDKAIRREVDFLIKRTNEKAVGEFDTIIGDRRTAASLCLLYSSMQWLSTQLRQLRFVVKKNEDDDPKQNRGNNRWTMLSAATGRDGDQPVILPLNDETIIAFDKVLSSYRELATKALRILHIDVRLDIIQKLSLVLESHYMLDQPVNEPDPSILKLNSDLVGFDDTISAFFPEKEYDFMTFGLAPLMDTYLVTSISKIKSMNENGCVRMLLNILVLQQNLRSVEKEAMLHRSAQYFEYFKQGPKAIIQTAKDTGGQGLGFNLDELKALIELNYSDGVKSGQRDVASQAKRAMGDNILQLTEYMWST